MATHSSTLAWKIPWTEERGRIHLCLQKSCKDNQQISRITLTSFCCCWHVTLPLYFG